MPKMKTNRAAAKRFKRTSGGTKLKRGAAFRRHILTKKTPKQKRQLRDPKYVAAADIRRVLRLLPG
ncbi:UNVERIFIED_CONTAM: hypothetical protein GTU68_053225 [Idotea baltica]|nr:hypothetical protein [Idotea baltica]